jgi:alpha-L-fucosidase
MEITRRFALKVMGGLAIAVHPVFGEAAGPFEPTWESLEQYRCPDWFRDAKLGFWTCWGPHSVPGFDDWYARNMYIEDSITYLHHLKMWGHPSKFGFKDFIPLWKGEKFDADRLTAMFKQAGAKYVATLASYHDNFDCFNSRYHRWNSVNLGPKKDIAGLWRQAALKHGLRFAVTEHLERSYSWFNVNKGHDKKRPVCGCAL